MCVLVCGIERGGGGWGGERDRERRMIGRESGRKLKVYLLNKENHS